MKQLTRFTVRPQDDGFVLRLEFAGGETDEIRTEPDELDSAIDTLNRMIAQGAADNAGGGGPAG
jgi:hypothetical protein